MSPSNLSEAVKPDSHAKVEVIGKVNLGTILELQQKVDRPIVAAFRMASVLPSDGTLLSVDTNAFLRASGALSANSSTGPLIRLKPRMS